jgi:type II secretory pathway pseudopilin PulG
MIFYKRKFTLQQLMIVVAVVAVLLSFLLEKLMPYYSSRATTAIVPLRLIITAQHQFRNEAIKDRDGDGIGEFGYFTELSGALPVPCGDSAKVAKPPFITSVFGSTSLSERGIATRNGYHYLIYLPSSGKKTCRENGKEIPAIKGRALSTQEEIEINRQEQYFAVYAWPISAKDPTTAAYFINSQGEIYKTDNLVVKNRRYTPYYEGSKGVVPFPQAEDIFDGTGDFILDGKIVVDVPCRTGLVWKKME